MGFVKEICDLAITKNTLRLKDTLRHYGVFIDTRENGIAAVEWLAHQGATHYDAVEWLISQFGANPTLAMEQYALRGHLSQFKELTKSFSLKTKCNIMEILVFGCAYRGRFDQVDSILSKNTHRKAELQKSAMNGAALSGNEPFVNKHIHELPLNKQNEAKINAARFFAEGEHVEQANTILCANDPIKDKIISSLIEGYAAKGHVNQMVTVLNASLSGLTGDPLANKRKYFQQMLGQLASRGYAVKVNEVLNSIPAKDHNDEAGYWTEAMGRDGHRFWRQPFFSVAAWHYARNGNVGEFNQLIRRGGHIIQVTDAFLFLKSENTPPETLPYLLSLITHKLARESIVMRWFPRRTGLPLTEEERHNRNNALVNAEIPGFTIGTKHPQKSHTEMSQALSTSNILGKRSLQFASIVENLFPESHDYVWDVSLEDLSEPKNKKSREPVSASATQQKSQPETSVATPDKSPPNLDPNDILMIIANKYINKSQWDIPKNLGIDSIAVASNDMNNLPVTLEVKLDFKLLTDNAATIQPPYHQTTNTIYFDESKQQGHLSYRWLSRNLTAVDSAFFIMLGRKEKAYVPPLNDIENTRCILVITKNEYNDLQSTLEQQPYDVLIIDDFVLPSLEKIRLEAVTVRRHAAILFSNEQRLRTMMLIDDNIQTISWQSNAVHNVSSNDLKTYLLQELHEKSEPIISIPTLRKDIVFKDNDKILGSKFFVIHLDAFRQKLSTTYDWLALLPENINAWGEDYYLQIMSYALFKSEKTKGFSTLSRQSITLERSKKDRSICVKSGMNVIALEETAAYQALMSLYCTPAVNQKRIAAKNLFNTLVKQSLAKHEEKRQEKNQYHFAFEKAKQANILWVIPEKPLWPPRQAFQKKLHNWFLTEASIQDYYEHQTDAVKFLKEHLVQPSESKDYLFDIAVGCGKTRIEAIFALTHYLSAPQRNVIVVAPTIQLVTQIKADFENSIDIAPFNTFRSLLWPRILAISSHMNHINHEALYENESLQQEGHVFVICLDSLVNLLKNDQSSDFFTKTSLIIYDEAHLVWNEAHALLQDKYKDNPSRLPILLHFTATPTAQLSSHPHFQFDMQQGIEKGIISPFILDTTLNYDSIAQNIPSILTQHHHPMDKRALWRHKGIIFTNSISEASSVATDLKTLKLGGMENSISIFEIHSKNPLVQHHIEAFTKAQTGIAVVVQMLTEGFNDPYISWIVIDKCIKDLGSLIQIIGRLTRNIPNVENKLGLVILPQETKEKNHVPQLASQKDKNDYQSAQITLGLFGANNKNMASNNSEEMIEPTLECS